MKRSIIPYVFVFILFANRSAAQNASAPLRIIAFGAHPDDAELRVGGMATLWAAKGYKVKLVAMTNGDVGHFEESGGALANRRTKEVQECAKIFGIETEVMDIHDGELEPTLENRKKVARLIRDWQADIVLCHRPYDYHPDHRYVGVLVQDAAVVVAAPFFTPDTRPAKRNPVFMYYTDNFTKPYPFDPTIVVGIDDVAESKWNCITAMPSQFGDLHSWQASTIPGIPTDDQGRKSFLLNMVKQWNMDVATKYRQRLVELYGKEEGAKIKYAEAFELCQYGRQATIDELKQIFLLDNKAANRPQKIVASPDSSLRLTASFGKGLGPSITYMEDVSAFGHFSAKDKIEWETETASAGMYNVYMEWSVPAAEAGKIFLLKTGNQQLKGTVEQTGSWQSFNTQQIGIINLKEGANKLVFMPASQFKTSGNEGGLLNLREIRLIPAK